VRPPGADNGRFVACNARATNPPPPPCATVVQRRRRRPGPGGVWSPAREQEGPDNLTGILRASLLKRLRGWGPQGRGGSNPPFCTTFRITVVVAVSDVLHGVDPRHAARCRHTPTPTPRPTRPARRRPSPVRPPCAPRCGTRSGPTPPVPLRHVLERRASCEHIQQGIRRVAAVFGDLRADARCWANRGIRRRNRWWSNGIGGSAEAEHWFDLAAEH
jgi:hypothetical protein